MGLEVDGSIFVPVERLGRQLTAIYQAWGMPAALITPTVDIMLAADTSGIDSHGASMMFLYERLREAGNITMTPRIEVIHDTPVAAVVDGGQGLGHAPSVRATHLAIDKAKALGVGIVTVRNSNHYGAAGAYALMMAKAGLIGVSMTAVAKPTVVPQAGKVAMFGTNPIAFAAPARRNPPFLLDMATSTVALGKLTISARAGVSVPEGWALDADGQPVTDPNIGLLHRLLTPLGATRLMGGHKGYGLAIMVEILSTTLAGSAFGVLREANQPGAQNLDVGHFFLAIDPSTLRPDGGFEDDLDAMIDALRATPPVDPAIPVQVAGDPEYRAAARRSVEGIPIPPLLAGELAAIAERAGAPFLLNDG
ncbi:MAG TPA: Ldh family oxidoreductase [Stellaceae bacterium]|nr:Ldh family oxidoreductase [Stellaceae bacterium]